MRRTLPILVVVLLTWSGTGVNPELESGGVTESRIYTQSTSGGLVPTLIWPVGRPNHDRVFLQLGPDTDPTSGVWRDWECYPQFTYDGHRGTDIMAYNFRVMDQGVAVLAAADGRVTWTQTGNFDRNYWTPYVGLPNGINIRHNDGSDSQYFHLRTHSVSVQPGDLVEQGQIIGYVGSSGQSPNPHLHFELWENGATRDPNNGTCNNRSSLWAEGFEHPASTELTILDWDVFLDTDLSGSENNNYIGDLRLKNRPFRPRSVATDQEVLGVWVQVQGLVGAQYQVRVLDNQGNEFASTTKGVAFARSVQWHPLYFQFGSRVAHMENPTGTWTVEVIQDGQPVKSKTFAVGDRTLFPIRFFPLAGRSLKLDRLEVRDTLRVRHATGAVSYELIDAPSGVSLDGDQVLIANNAAFSNRNGHFQVSATDEAATSDTMYYHVVLFDKPLAGITTSVETEQPNASRLLSVYPNPFASATTVRLMVEEPGRHRARLFDLLGRETLTLNLGDLAVGEQRFRLPAQGLATGMYVLEVSSPLGSSTQPVHVN